MRWLVTGGAGFIGTNLVAFLVESGHDVVVADDLSRDGSEKNAEFLRVTHGVAHHVVDITDDASLSRFLRGQPSFDAIAHLAGQVSLLASIEDPIRDFAINARGTLNVLEHVRKESPETVVIGMSSNKIYGDLESVGFTETASRYVAPEWPDGFDESLPIDCHGPYGCSKGVADQYLADYSRTYGLRTVSLRQSSVYGPHQHPRSDQGWVAHLTGEALAGREIQLNGIGKQVRDLLHAHDLARLFVLLAEHAEPHGSHQFNVGGGPANALSILELFDWLSRSAGAAARFRPGAPRPSDQKLFISDNASVHRLTGWMPAIDLDAGLTELLDASAGR